MMKAPIPRQIALKISNDAVAHARNAMSGFGWSEKSLQALQSMADDGKVGIRTTQKYLMFQERGIKPFLMTWVNGRTLPMGCKSGDGPHFRRGGHVGEPGYVDIPHVGKVWRDARWKHPGLQPKNFMRDGLQQAIQANQPLIRQWVRGLMKGVA
jgi:hypothetical protein